MNLLLGALAPAVGPWIMLLIKLIIIGLVLYIFWILIQKIPMEATIKQVVNIVFLLIVILVVVYLVIFPLLSLL
jgi:dolichyl-phosphate-mannose--protein O-mannosyl transferase